MYYENLHGFMWGLYEAGKINEKQREALSAELLDIYRPAKEDTENE